MSTTVTKPVTKATSSHAKREDIQNPELEADSIVGKTMRMVEALKKYPRPAK
ncbi:hypothetical protein SAMN04487996_11337 [Dyadobacter soli]|uniref:Uncharacterized protein n=1 Tax=Dyadobacter soli TaxID=659014 RepID=A0A1G7PKE2_9BACT|nr:hypothetical protein [Dyadobacter soli]SDF86604.1 hypothetical protein SAMN04487996_11337 [Dyadobacter soli]